MSQAEDRIQTSHNLTELEDELDQLWAKYLDCLDQYQSTMTALSKHLSTGFFSLAQANMRSPGKRRYGQDFYDERMKASRHFSIMPAPAGGLVVELSDETALGPLEIDEENSQDEPKQEPSPPSTPPPDGDGIADSKLLNSNASSVKPSTDPLRWFGILLPQGIRDTQSAFIEAVGNPMIEAVNSSREMKLLETEIRKQRKLIKKAAAEA